MAKGRPVIRVAGEAPGLFAPLDLVLAEGRVTCLLGPSGVGKSTLLRLLAGLPTGVAFAGRTEAVPAALMGQDPALYPWLDVLGNVTLGARLRGQSPDTDRALAILEDTGLGGLSARRPAQLSGGQRQRAALARTLMEDRPLVLLDEPFSALDPGLRIRIGGLAIALLRGRTVLIVTHDPAEAARLADAIFVMTPAGLAPAAVPDSPVPRDHAAPEVLALTAELTERLLA